MELCSVAYCKVGLEPPLRQGQTKYPWLIMQWDNSEETDVTLNIEE
jgi:structure-specific recognition protein 1